MTCMVVYTYNNSFNTKGFGDIKSAQAFIKGLDPRQGYNNIQILVDYEVMKVYQEQYLIMRDLLANTLLPQQLRKVL